MRLIVDPEIVGRFPGLRIGVVHATSLDNRGTNEDLEREKALALERVSGSIDDIMASPEILSWRDAYREFGAKPKSHRPTAEAFLKRIAKSGDFPRISPAVDAYLLSETVYRLPVGGYDLATVSGDIRLRFSSGDERFVPIGGAAEEVTFAGEVVYSDSDRVLTRRWNYKDCDETKITEDSRKIALFVEAPYESVGTDALIGAIDDIANNLRRYCAAEVRTGILTVASANSLDIESIEGASSVL